MSMIHPTTFLYWAAELQESMETMMDLTVKFVHTYNIFSRRVLPMCRGRDSQLTSFFYLPFELTPPFLFLEGEYDCEEGQICLFDL